MKQTALQHQTKGISGTFVAVTADQDVIAEFQASGYEISPISILGLYALASAVVLMDDLPIELAKRYPRQLPVTRLGCLAIRADMQS